MAFLLVLLFVTLADSVSISIPALYRKTVIHFKDPDFEAGKTTRVAEKAKEFLKDIAHFRPVNKNAQLALDHNEENNLEWIAEINEFTLETEEEFKRHLGLNATDEQLAEASVQRAKRDATEVDREEQNRLEELTIDHTDKLPPIKDQGGCGSCWTFSAMASLEYQVNKDKTAEDPVIALSESQCVDCTSREGCQGGWMSTCYEYGYYHFNHWASSKRYTYDGEDALPCRYDEFPNAMRGHRFKVAGTTYVDCNDDGVVRAVANHNIGVVAAAVQVAGGFSSYKSGVFSSDGCGGCLNHAVNVVGYGRMDGIPYFRVRNSWGTWWGDGGYINLKRGVGGNNLNMCGISGHAQYPELEATGEEEEEEEEIPVEECADNNQSGYRGTVSTTVTGKTCQRWDSQDPHSHTRTPENYGWAGLVENYCRNPDGEAKAWCYTTDVSSRFELCDIPDCSQFRWCELEDAEFEKVLPGSAVYSGETAVQDARAACYPDSQCMGYKEQPDGSIVLMTGVRVPVHGETVEITFKKGLCNTLNPPTSEFDCVLEGVDMGVWELTIAWSVLEANQICTAHEDCAAFHGPYSDGSYRLFYGISDMAPGPGTTWLWTATADECPSEIPDFTTCAEGSQRGYRGTLSVTEEGYTCQRWDSQVPNEHTRTPENYPDSGLEENYCRNPDNSDRAWCYTVDGDRWAYCDVPLCNPPDDTKCADGDQREYRGDISVTTSGKTCQRWDSQSPNSHTRTPENYPNSGLEDNNYCRNPDGESKAWCYTTDGARWEVCDVPYCS